MKTNNKSSMVERHLKSNKGNICHWWGIEKFHLFDEHEVKMIAANDKNHLLVYID